MGCTCTRENENIKSGNTILNKKINKNKTYNSSEYSNLVKNYNQYFTNTETKNNQMIKLLNTIKSDILGIMTRLDNSENNQQSYPSSTITMNISKQKNNCSDEDLIKISNKKSGNLNEENDKQMENLEHIEANPYLIKNKLFQKIDKVINYLEDNDNKNDKFEELTNSIKNSINDVSLNKDTIDLIQTYSHNYQSEIHSNNMLKLIMNKSKVLTNKNFTTCYKKISKGELNIVNEIQNEQQQTKLRSSINSLKHNILVISKVQEKINKLNSFDFNIFEVDSVLKEKTLPFISAHIFRQLGVFQENMVSEENYNQFAIEITQGYDRSIIYHNDLHGADVFQTVYNIIMQNNSYISKLNFVDLDIFVFYLCAICHDYKHNGLNNTYHMNAITDIAIQFNDVAILENFHTREAFKLLIKHKLFDHLSKEEFKLIRRRFIDTILATDMANHFKHCEKIKFKLSQLDIKNGNNIEKLLDETNITKKYENQQDILNLIIHSADVSNPAKPYVVYKKWVDCVMREFFHQGDLEKSNNLPITINCDRDTTSIPKSQVSFINFIVLPLYEILCNVMPNIKPYLENIKLNKNIYNEKYKEEQEKNLNKNSS